MDPNLRPAHAPVPTNDLWIASLAVQHHLLLLTRDEHFQKLPQVARGSQRLGSRSYSACLRTGAPAVIPIARRFFCRSRISNSRRRRRLT